MFFFAILNLSFLFGLFLLFKKKPDTIFHPAFVFFFYSSLYIVLGCLSLLFEPYPLHIRYYNEKIFDLSILIILSLSFASILFAWLNSTRFKYISALKCSFDLPHYINYGLATSLFFLPTYFSEPVAIYVSATSSLKFFTTLSNKSSSLIFKFIDIIVPSVPLLLCAILNATSKRVSIFPFVIAFFVVLIKEFSGTGQYRLVNVFRYIKLKQLRKIFVFVLAVPFLFIGIMFLQLLRSPENPLTLLTALQYYFSPQNLFKLLEFSTLYIHSINFWNLISIGDIHQTMLSPLLKLFGLGFIPFTGDRILSFNDIYTGTIEPLYREIGGSHPTLKWISSLGLFYFPLNLIYPFLSLLVLSLIFRVTIKYYNALVMYVIFPYFSISFARGSDISLAIFELIATLFILFVATTFSKLIHSLSPLRLKLY